MKYALLNSVAYYTHLGLLPQGQPERLERAARMVERMDAEGFGSCTNHGACQTACPKKISVDTIQRLNADLIKSSVR